MARPIRLRNAQGYQREIESLGRLRTALRLDAKLPGESVETTIKTLDALTDHLQTLMRLKEAASLARIPVR